MRSIYFIGIGGIGMSALARYFLAEGWAVAGYDLTRTALTEALEREGAAVHYVDSVDEIPLNFRDPQSTLVVYTPAVPADMSELSWFLERGFMVEKRSEMLGHVSAGKFTMAVAGTHGKTTTTTMVAWLNRALTGSGAAFLGGISKNFGSNLVLGTGSLAVEADEFDRSFLRLNPDVALITSVDPDHLDIYGTYDAVKEAFSNFVDRIKPGGALILNSKVDIEVRNSAIEVLRYSADDLPADVVVGIPGAVNRENAAGAVAMVRAAARLRGETIDEDKLREALSTFSGVRRRFDIWVNSEKGVYMDDYAHHPDELRAALTSLKGMFPNRKITAVFQPHLYTRTRDFADQFGAALSMANEVLLTPIYPARELPIEGVNSELIGKFVAVPWEIITKEDLAQKLRAMATDVVVTFGAGNIENHCAEIADAIKSKI